MRTIITYVRPVMLSHLRRESHPMPLPHLRTISPSRRTFRPAPSFRPALVRLEERTVPSATIVKDISPNPAAAAPHDLTAVGNKLFFVDSNPAAKALFLWVTDGTGAGTTPLKALATDPNAMAAFDGRVY